MNRIELIRKLIEDKKYSSYLEIGIYRGTSFFSVRCHNKIAVDPYMKVSWRGKIHRILQNPDNLKNRYFEITSDEFFKNKAPKIFKRTGVDIVFIDGLHTFEASLNDVLNSLKYLNNNGTIIMHDCYPPHKASATPAASFHDAKSMNVKGWTGQWCGDVWKTVVYLKEKYPHNLDVRVLNADFGLGLINVSTPIETELAIDKVLFQKVNSLEYETVFSNPQHAIGLKEIQEFLV